MAGSTAAPSFRLFASQETVDDGRDPTFALVTDGGRVAAAIGRADGMAAAADPTRQQGGGAERAAGARAVILAVDGTGSMHTNMPFVREMLLVRRGPRGARAVNVASPPPLRP